MIPSLKTKLVLAIFVLTGFAFASSPLNAQAVINKPADVDAVVIDQLLNQFWTNGLKNRKASEAAWQSYNSVSNSPSPQVQWAYVLNRIEHNKVREARASIDDLVSPSANAWSPRYVQVWLKLSVGEVDAALLDMQEIKTRINATPDLDETTRFKLFTRLGRLYGFAEGPRRDQATPSTLEETLVVLQEGLNDIDFGNFEDDRKQVSNQFVALVNEKSDTVTTRVEEQKQTNMQRTSKINSDNHQMEVRQRDLALQTDSLRSQLNQATAPLRQSIGPIESDLNRIDSAIRSSNIYLSRLRNDVSNLEFLAHQETCPYRRADLLNQAARIRSVLFSEESRRSGLQSQYDGALTQLNLIGSQIAEIERQFGGQISTLKLESKQMLGQQRRNQRELKKLQNPKAKTGYVRAMSAKTSHLPTYDPFPADEFRREALK